MKRDPLSALTKSVASNNKKRMTWEETYRDMARKKEDWSDLDTTVADGMVSRNQRPPRNCAS